MEITSKQNTYIKEYRKLTEQRKYRRQTGYFVCEGAKLAVEAVKSGCALGENAYYTAAAAEKYPECISLLRKSCKMIQISEEVADSISDTKSPQGIFITVRHLDKILNLSTIDSSRQFIILENLQDMGWCKNYWLNHSNFRHSYAPFPAVVSCDSNVGHTLFGHIAVHRAGALGGGGRIVLGDLVVVVVIIHADIRDVYKRQGSRAIHAGFDDFRAQIMYNPDRNEREEFLW